jgi:6-phosphogluconolactonase
MKFFLTIFLSVCYLVTTAQQHYLLVGTYDSPKSEGIYVYRFNSNDGTAKNVSHIKTSNPSFLAVSPNEKYVYAVNENADSTKYTVTGHVAAFSFDKKKGSLSFLNKQESGGKHPCYVAIDKTGKWVMAGNYSSGNFSILNAKKNGKLLAAKQTVQHTGSGPDKSRQQSPHVHGIFLKENNTDLYVTDLGIDKIMKYNFNPKKGIVTAAQIPYAEADAGSGPRHLAFHPTGTYVYLLEELAGSVSVYKDSAGKLEKIQSHSSLPLYYKGPAGSADIHVSADGKFLYCSNRGNSHSIGIFSINAATGMITLVGHQETLGEAPRNFNFDPTEKFLLVGNQNTDEIVIFKRDTITGLLTDSGNRIAVGKPVCLKWIAVQ